MNIFSKDMSLKTCSLFIRHSFENQCEALIFFIGIVTIKLKEKMLDFEIICLF